MCHQAQFCFVFFMVVSLPQLKLNKTKEKLPSLKHYFIVKIFLGVVIVKRGKVFMLGKLSGITETEFSRPECNSIDRKSG